MPDSWLMLGAAALGAALGGLFHGVSGLAFPAVALSLWAWTLPPQIAAPLAAFGALLAQVASLGSLRRGFDLRRAAPLILGGALGAPIGVFLLHNADPLRFRLAIGTLLTLTGLVGLAMREGPRVTAGGGGLDAFAGLVGGVLGGFAGMADAAPAIWLQARGWKRDLKRAATQIYAIVTLALTLAVFASTGALDAAALPLFALVAPAMLIASFLGALWRRRVSEKTFERLALAFVLASGVALLAVGAHVLPGWR